MIAFSLIHLLPPTSRRAHNLNAEILLSNKPFQDLQPWRRVSIFTYDLRSAVLLVDSKLKIGDRFRDFAISIVVRVSLIGSAVVGGFGDRFRDFDCC